LAVGKLSKNLLAGNSSSKNATFLGLKPPFSWKLGAIKSHFETRNLFCQKCATSVGN